MYILCVISKEIRFNIRLEKYQMRRLPSISVFLTKKLSMITDLLLLLLTIQYTPNLLNLMLLIDNNAAVYAFI